MSEPRDTLDDLQRRVLLLLAGVRPRWVLIGGGALAGLYLHHRKTRDLDLLWRGRADLGDLGRECEARLTAAGLDVSTLQSASSFRRLRVSSGESSVVVDLVAEPDGSIEAPTEIRVAGVALQVASRHEILVDKLCALLGCSEVRDLIDVRALLAEGGDLDRALLDAPKRDAGFSPLTLAWVLRSWPVAQLARATRLPDDEALALERFHQELIARLVEARAPDLEADITFLRTEEGGRASAACSGWRPGFVWERLSVATTERHDGECTFPARDCVPPGESAGALIRLFGPEHSAGRLAEGTEFTVLEGLRIVARGRVTRIVNPVLRR